MKVYIAGPTFEMLEVLRQVQTITSAGIEVTYNWCAQRIEDGRDDHVISTSERETLAARMFAGIREAHVVWAIMPSEGVVTRGLYYEIGYAIGQCRPVIVSGDDKRCVFSSMARRSLLSHDGAAAYLIDAKRSMDAGDRAPWAVGI